MERLREEEVDERVASLVECARQHARRGEEQEALAALVDAWQLLPSPRRGSDGREILRVLAEVLARRGDVSSAITVLLGA
jgi:thioredoxin-like negative regulator of GroEL